MLKAAADQGRATAYEFGAYYLDVVQRRLLRGGRAVAMFPKSLDTLALLLERQGQLLSKDFMLRQLWPGVVVQENSLPRAICDVRKALEDNASDHRYVITVPRRGYLFAADVPVRVHFGAATQDAGAPRVYGNADVKRELALGRHFEGKRTAAGVRRAIEHFERAIAADERCAQAHAAIARAYNTLSVHSAVTGGLPAHETRPKARAAALRALALPDAPVDALVALASVQFFYDWDFDAGERTFERAVQADPDNAEARHVHAVALSMLGRHEEAWCEIQRARALEPVSLIINANVGFVLYYAGRYAEAVEELAGAVSLDPHFAVARHRLGLVYEALAEYEKAEVEFNAMAPSESEPLGWSSLAYLYAISGRAAAARGLVDRLLALAQRRYVSPWFIAQAYAGLGDHDAALAYLERAFDERSTLLVGVHSSPRWARLRGEPRFEDLVRRVGLGTRAAVL